MSSINNARIWDAVRKLREEGCAVAILEPEELEGTAPDAVQDSMIDAGLEAVRMLKYHENNGWV